VLGCLFGSLLGGALPGERRALAAAFEAARAGARPAERISAIVSDGHRGVVEGRLDVGHPQRNIPADLATFCLGHLQLLPKSVLFCSGLGLVLLPAGTDHTHWQSQWHPRYRRSFTPFLPATVFL